MVRYILMMLSLLAAWECGGKALSPNIVFIGNSITHGAKHADWTKTAPPNVCAEWLSAQDGVEDVNFLNAGKSGKTTFHFLPDRSKVIPAGDPLYFSEVVEETRKIVAKHPDQPLIFSFMLGTNDSADRPKNKATTKEQYIENMTAIIDSLLALWPDAHVVLNKPIYYSPGFVTKSGTVMDETALGRIGDYSDSFTEIIAKTKKGQVHIGDSLGYGYFKHNWKSDIFEEKDRDGKSYWLHPNEKGAKALGEFWGKAILPVLADIKTPSIYVAPYKEGRKGALSLTFDDGLLEHHSVLRGELKKRGLPATFAIVGTRVGKDFKGIPAMDWSQINDLVADGHEISNHGYEHLNGTGAAA